uniref:Uncharacterized protein n=1 Tax=Romanomermis culicivorax TaxID=13658 RepID=A0A915J8G4_ROMCU
MQEGLELEELIKRGKEESYQMNDVLRQTKSQKTEASLCTELNIIQNSKYHLNVTKKFFDAFNSISEHKYNSTTNQKCQSSNDGDRNDENAEKGSENFRPILRSAIVDVIPVPHPIIEFDTHIYRYQLKKLRRYYQVSGMKKHQTGVDILLRLLDDSFYLASIFDQTIKISRNEKMLPITESESPEVQINDVERPVNDFDANENKDEQQENSIEPLLESAYSTIGEPIFEKGSFTADEIEKLASDLAHKNQIFQNASRRMEIFAGLLSGPSTRFFEGDQT